MLDVSVAKRAEAMTASRLALLYGDLCLNTKTVASIFCVSEAHAIETIACHSVKWCHGVYGQLSRRTFRALAAIMGFDPNDVDLDDRKEWQVMKAVLGREFLRLAIEDAIPWRKIDAFLARLPAIQEEAEKRVTASRLQFLYGDLGATVSEIMMMLDVTERDVQGELVVHEIERHRLYHEELNERVLDELAKRLGLDAWPKHWHERSTDSRYWPTVKREVREGLVQLAEKERFDLVILDEFLANLPVIAEQLEAAKRARLDQIVPRDGKAAASSTSSPA